MGQILAVPGRARCPAGGAGPPLLSDAPSAKGPAMKRLALLLACAAACKSAPPAAPAPAAAAAAKPDARATADAVVAATDRAEADRKLDLGRKPAEMLEFLGVKQGMKVEDLGAGGGYTTELLARAVGPDGVVYMQNDPRWMSFLKDRIAERLTHPAMKNAVRVDVPFDDPAPPGVKDLDLAVLNVIYHDIANMPVDRVRMNQVIFNALKPGGVYVVIDSSAKNGSGLSATQSLHRIDEKVVKEEVTKAGFKLGGEGNFLRNPEDTRDWNSSPRRPNRRASAVRAIDSRSSSCGRKDRRPRSCRRIYGSPPARA